MSRNIEAAKNFPSSNIVGGAADDNFQGVSKFLPSLFMCVFATVLACVVFVLFLCLNILVGDNLLFVSV